MIGQAHLGYISDWLDSRNSVPGMGTGAASIFLPPALHQLFIDWDNNLLLPRHRIFLVSSHIPHSYCSEFPIPIPHSHSFFACHLNILEILDTLVRDSKFFICERTSKMFYKTQSNLKVDIPLSGYNS